MRNIEKPTMPQDLPNRVLAILQQHRGQESRITRLDLIKQAFNLATLPKGFNLANSAQDRQVRAAIEELQSRFPILASSSTGGYYYASSVEEVEAYAAELQSRATKLLEKSRQLRRLAVDAFGAQMRLL